MQDYDEERLIKFCSCLKSNKPVTVTVIPGVFTEIKHRYRTWITDFVFFDIDIKFDPTIIESLPYEVQKVLPSWCRVSKEASDKGESFRSFVIYQDDEKMYITNISGDVKSMIQKYQESHKYIDFKNELV